MRMRRPGQERQWDTEELKTMIEDDKLWNKKPKGSSEFETLGEGMCVYYYLIYTVRSYRLDICDPHSPSNAVQNQGMQ